MTLTSSRADVDVCLDLVPNTAEEIKSARLYVTDTAGRLNLSVEETRELLRALGLVEANLPPIVGKHSKKRRKTDA